MSRNDDVVVGLDEGPAAADALRWAAKQARMTGQALRVVHVWKLRSFGVVSVTDEYVEASRTDARARATRRVLQVLGSQAARTRWTLDVIDGLPGPVLVDRSSGAMLLVVGTRDHTGLRRAVLGSVSHYCLSHATCPVVAVPATSVAMKQAAHTG